MFHVPGSLFPGHREEGERHMTNRIIDGLPPIKVVGVGGGGCNAVDHMIQARIAGVEFVGVNTDEQALGRCLAETQMKIGARVTKGLGAGSDPEKGRAAADESREELKDILKGTEMVFITAGMGGGTGTGAAPVIAGIAKDLGALTVAVVTKPFGFEGSRRREQAELGIQALHAEVDTLIAIPNDRLLAICDQKTSVKESFRMADEVLRQGIQGIAEIITTPGDINLDFADVRRIMSEAGPALMAIGRSTGENRAVEAAQSAISSPLLDVNIHGATRHPLQRRVRRHDGPARAEHGGAGHRRGRRPARGDHLRHQH